MLFSGELLATESFRGPEVTQFEVKPIFCVIGRSEQVCGIEVNVDWQLQQPMSVCLEVIQARDSSELERHCWQQASDSHKAALEMQLTGSVDIELQQSSTNKVMARQHLPLYVEKRINHRGRSPWEFF